VRRRPPVEALKRPRRPPRRRGRLSSHGGPFRRRLRHGVRLPSPLECSCRHGSPWLRQGVGHHAGRRRPAVRYPPAEPGAEMGADRGLSTASHVVKSRRTAAAHCRTIPRIGRPRGRQPRAAGRQSLTPFSGPDYTAVLQGISPVLTVICSKSSRPSPAGSGTLFAQIAAWEDSTVATGRGIGCSACHWRLFERFGLNRWKARWSRCRR
jgi:hypothetical protein